ncbi:hypothetical protein BIV57_01225 [Mangrovactinospora gilvigrisea]|uniref:Sugar ABC transporter substrate-binding protein n=1 Tax=Mangrovactinospora gilvigrisea TaxID=1428644 RepID=A0A1J7BLA1_9ACTN|nr:extracellular solute-binding protein [Mangrovactinospora gilvigrisea]OIV39483.1 hypothetical protein BIV57_01225 [Mangrovactinospora gilvigrisea]
MAALTRRTLLRTTGAAVAASTAPTLLTACGSGASSGNVANKGTKLAPWPTYIPKTGPAPDLKGDPARGIDDAYLTYPAKLTKGTSGKPGDGSTLKVMTITYGTPPTPEAKNAYWQAMEKALGVKIEFTAVPASDFQSKMATVMAGNDLPDVLNIGGGFNLPHEADFVMKTMADLSDYVSGDAVKDYPNLANIPTRSWRSVGRFHGGIYGVPITRAKPSSVLWINGTDFAKHGYKPDGNLTQDQFTGILRDLTRGKQYGTGGAQDGSLGYTAHAMCFGIPNGWSLKGGTFTSQFASPHWKDMLSYLNTLWKTGLYYPDSASTSMVDLKTMYYNGTVKSYTDGFTALLTTLNLVHDFAAEPMTLYTPSGITPTPYAGHDKFGYTVINKNLPKAKIKMVLRVLDHLASPFGTQEYQLMHYGVEGVDFTFSASGDPTPTKRGQSENNVNLPFGYLCDAPQVLYVPGAQQGIKSIHQWQQLTCPTMISDPTNGLRSDTATSTGATLTQNMSDTIVGIITGRQKVSTWDAAVHKWKSGGGDRMAHEYASELAANTTK